MPPTIGSTRLLGRLERIARRNTPVKEPRAPGIPGAFDSVIERFEVRLARAEAQAARAFESVAQILERDDAARDGDRRALIDAVRRLEFDPGELDRRRSGRRDARRWFRSSLPVGPEGAVRSQGRGVANRHASSRARGPRRGNRPHGSGSADGRFWRGRARASQGQERSGRPGRQSRSGSRLVCGAWRRRSRRRGAAHAIIAR